MRKLAALGDDYVTLGLTPLSGPVDRWLAVARKWSFGFYDFRGVRMFKAKLSPQSWERIYLTYPASSSAPWVYDTLTAFARGSLAGFGLQTVVRGPAVVCERARVSVEI